jgi:hypothetical protein
MTVVVSVISLPNTVFPFVAVVVAAAAVVDDIWPPCAHCGARFSIHLHFDRFFILTTHSVNTSTIWTLRTSGTHNVRILSWEAATGI